MIALDRLRTIVTLWVRSRAESWANPNLDDYIDPTWQRHPGLVRATHPKVEPEIPEET